MKHPRVVKNLDQRQSLFGIYLQKQRDQVAILLAQAVFKLYFCTVFELIVDLNLSASKGGSAMAHLVQQDAQGPHIDKMVVRPVRYHFWRHILQSATEGIALL